MNKNYKQYMIAGFIWRSSDWNKIYKIISVCNRIKQRRNISYALLEALERANR